MSLVFTAYVSIALAGWLCSEQILRILDANYMFLQAKIHEQIQAYTILQ